MTPFVLAVLAASWSQTPPVALHRPLADPDMSVRWEAIHELARGGETWRDWMLKEAQRGAPAQQRALLLALALEGSEKGILVIRQASKPGSRADPQRSWALLLRGAFDPAANQDSAELLKKLNLSFDRDCFLVGLLGQANGSSDLRTIFPKRRRQNLEHEAVLFLLDVMAGRSVVLPKEASTPALKASALLASLWNQVVTWPTESLESLEQSGLDPLWLLSARRASPRTLSDLQQSGIGSASGGYAMVLHEVTPQDVGKVFSYLESRLQNLQARAWLFGAAGERGWAPSFSTSSWEDARAAGLFCLGLHDPITAASAAVGAREAARKHLAATPNLEISWPAAAVLALAPEKKDLDWLRTQTEQAEGVIAARLHPIWQLASGRADEGGARALLRKWSRELGAGRSDFFRQQMGRWAVLYLTSGSLATEDSMDWSRFAMPFEQKRPHPPGHDLWLDLLWFLDQDFPWDFRVLED